MCMCHMLKILRVMGGQNSIKCKRHETVATGFEQSCVWEAGQIFLNPL